MTTKTNSAEGGTNGTVVTTANSGGGSGTPFDLKSSPSGSITFDSGSAVHGSLGYLFAPASGQQALLRWTGFNDVAGCLRKYLKNAPAAPAAIETIGGFYTSSDVRILSMAYTPAQKYVVVDGGGTTLLTSTNSYQAGDRIEFSFTIATSTTGSWNWALYRGDSTTALETRSGSTANFGTANWNYFQFGKITSSTSTQTLSFDDIAVKDGSTTFFGVPSIPPTASFTSDVWGQTINFDASGSSPSGGNTIVSYAWIFGDGGTATGVNPSHAYASAGSYNVQLTVTDSASGIANVTNTVVAVAPKGTVAPIFVTTTWIPSGGTALSCLADTDPSTLITSPNAPSGSTVDVWYEAMIPPAAGQPAVFSCLVDRLNSSSGSVTAQLYDKSTNTLIATVSGVAVSAGTGTSVGTSPLIFSFPAASITGMSAMGWNKPRVVYAGTAS